MAAASAILPAPDANWYAVYTNVNQERQVAERFEQRGLEFYLPLYRTVRQRCDRRVQLSLPLFPGYLFVRMAWAARLRVLEVPRVVRVVGSASGPVVVAREEIDLLRRGLSGEVHAEPCRYLVEGCRVRVVNGPFVGAEGVLLRRKQVARVVLSVRLIMRSFQVEVGEGDVERL